MRIYFAAQVTFTEKRKWFGPRHTDMDIENVCLLMEGGHSRFIGKVAYPFANNIERYRNSINAFLKCYTGGGEGIVFIISNELDEIVLKYILGHDDVVTEQHTVLILEELHQWPNESFDYGGMFGLVPKNPQPIFTLANRVRSITSVPNYPVKPYNPNSLDAVYYMRNQVAFVKEWTKKIAEENEITKTN